MLAFCPWCGSTLGLEQGPECLRFYCRNCPYIHNITRKISSRRYPKLKEVDNAVLGGADAWKNVDRTQETCPKCHHDHAYFMQIQTRSADEPMTIFYKCCNRECNHRWKQD